jgi:ribosomal silencing factor RsfS
MPKFKASADPESEWSLIDVGDGVCINLMTAEGRQKWDLEGAWKPVK